MLNKAKLIGWFAKTGAAAKAFAIIHAPTALAIAGGALLVWAIVETAKAASQPSEAAEELATAVDDLEDANVALQNAVNDPEADHETIQTLRGDKRRALRRVVSAGAKKYKKPIWLATCGLAAIAGGYLWLFRRYTQTAATLATTAATLRLIDKNCRDTFGDNATNALYSENFNSEEFKTKVYERLKASEEQGRLNDANLPETDINDEIAGITNDIIGDEDMPEKSIYHWNRYTVEDGCYVRGIDNQLFFLRSRLMKLQNLLDNTPYVTFLSRGYVLKELGLHGATVHPNTTVGKIELEKDHKWGWVKGDTIDIGLSSIFKQLTANISNPDWIEYLNEQYNDIIIHLNDAPDAVYGACLYDEKNPRFVGAVPKKFKSLFSSVAHKVFPGKKEVLAG